LANPAEKVPRRRHLQACRRSAGGLAAVIETPAYDLTIFKLHCGRLTLKAYRKGEHVLRFEAIVHNTRELHCGRVLDKFGEMTDPPRCPC
jgi:hypothetical protein